MTLRNISIIALIACGWSEINLGTCAAQNRGSTNQRGASGQNTGGQSAFGGGGQSAFGGGAGGGRGQSRAGAGYGANSFGAPGQGTGFGGTGAGQALGNNQLGVVGQDNFIGNDAAQSQNFFRNMNGGQRQNPMFDFMIENLNEMRDRGNRGNGGDRSPPVRVKLRPAFETPLGTMQQITSDLQSRLTTNVSDLGVADSKISMDGRTLTLEGKVVSEHQRSLIEKIISLEPGVTTIDNRLIVDPTVAEKE
jgi:hypothetical protein